MAHSLNLRVIAEGVEHPRQSAFLNEHGCDEAQGYLLGRPAEAATLTELPRLVKVSRLHEAPQSVRPKNLL
jgi:EAL domain-containing protein (putative c-di-GMP-specific phosphodiesterase class I)